MAMEHGKLWLPTGEAGRFAEVDTEGIRVAMGKAVDKTTRVLFPSPATASVSVSMTMAVQPGPGLEALKKAAGLRPPMIPYSDSDHGVVGSDIYPAWPVKRLADVVDDALRMYRAVT